MKRRRRKIKGNEAQTLEKPLKASSVSPGLQDQLEAQEERMRRKQALEAQIALDRKLFDTEENKLFFLNAAREVRRGRSSGQDGYEPQAETEADLTPIKKDIKLAKFMREIVEGCRISELLTKFKISENNLKSNYYSKIKNLGYGLEVADHQWRLLFPEGVSGIIYE